MMHPLLPLAADDPTPTVPTGSAAGVAGARPPGVRAVVRPARERGFVAVTTAILLIIMLMATALALDVAVWYMRGLELQRSADAAALSAVVRMPNFVKAEAAARESAVRNGLEPGAIVVTRDPKSPRRIKVSVKQNVQSFFGKLLRPSTVVGRQATAEFVSAIDMGSKLNGIGTANLISYPVVGDQGFWLAINGYCTAKEDGDRFASAFDGNRAGRVTSCSLTPPVVENDDYRRPGTDAAQYTYLVNVPCPTVGEDPCTTNPARDTVVEVYNPQFDMSNEVASIDTNTIQDADPNFGNSQINTSFGLRNPDGDPMPAPNTPRSYGTCNNCSGSNGWTELFRIPASAGAGPFKIDVNTDEGQANSYGSNAFALLAHWAGDPIAPCADCATMSGESSVGVYANASGDTVDFFLARLSPALDFRGKRIQILLWDVGEGANTISILQPTALSGYQPIPFRFRTFDHGLVGVPDDDRFPLTNVPGGVLDVSGPASTLGPQAPPWPLSERANDFKFNGRMISLELTVPTDYGCVPLSRPCVPAPLPEDGWWKIRYTTSLGAVFDRSTWTVRLLGDPVHLVAE